MFGSDGFFGNKKTDSSTENQDALADAFKPVESSSDNQKPPYVKSAAGLGIAILLVAVLLGLDRAVSNSTHAKKSRKKTNVVNTDFVIDDYEVPLSSLKKDADSYKEKQGFFSSFFCGGYQKSSFCK